MFDGIVRWDLIVMFSLMAAITSFEMIGVFSTHFITLTQIIKSWMPMPLRIMVLAWLCWHFVGSDLWPNYIKGN